MSDSWGTPWSNNPNAPQIPYGLYLPEKTYFAGNLIGAIVYGVVVALFFQCISALLNPANRMKGSVKWGLVAHTTAMFSFLTIPAAIHFNLQSISYIDDREYPGDGEHPPGPFGSQFFTKLSATNVFLGVMFPLNQWLADGLLLYRCCVIYAMDYRIVAFPCLVYLASVAIGILHIYEGVRPFIVNTTTIDAGISYFAISVSLNILLMLMIVVRLLLHSRNIRSATGASAGASGLYNAVITMLVESYALYAATYLLYLGLWVAECYVEYIFIAFLGEVQVIAPFLITLRVANRRALTGDMIYSGNSIDSIRFRGQGESTSDSGTLSEGNRTILTEANGETPGDGDVGVYDIVEVPSSLKT